MLCGEGARGSLSKKLIAKFDLAKDREPQKFGIGLKELWKVAPDKHKPGLVQHSFGWPLGNSTGGGSFLYHLEDNQVAVGFVITGVASGAAHEIRESPAADATAQAPIADWELLRATRQSGVEIGSHTRTHPSLTQLRGEGLGVGACGKVTAAAAARIRIIAGRDIGAAGALRVREGAGGGGLR